MKTFHDLKLVKRSVQTAQKPALDVERQQKQAEVADIVDKLFVQLKAACPAMFHTLKADDEKAVKRQWIVGFIENNVNPAMLNAGMRIARQQSNPFMPSVGQFIEWCEKGLAAQYQLLTADELVKKTLDYAAAKGFDNFCDFDFGSNANYWLITDLYQAMRDENLNNQKMTERASKMIAVLAKKLMKGYIIPEPAKSLPTKVQSRPLNREESLARLSEIKRKFGFSNDSQQTAAAS